MPLKTPITEGNTILSRLGKHSKYIEPNTERQPKWGEEETHPKWKNKRTLQEKTQMKWRKSTRYRIQINDCKDAQKCN